MTGDILILLARRTPWALLTIFLASVLSFSIMYFAPGNPAEIILTQETGNEPTRETVLLFMNNHGLEQPFLKQYAAWMTNLLSGSLGISLRTGDPVLEEFTARFPATFILAVTAMVLALLVGISIGVLSAMRPHSPVDIFGNFIASMGTSIPSFWLALLLILIFSIHLNILPSFGYGGIQHLILPTLSLGFLQISRILKITRESMLDALSEDYVFEAYAKGLSEKEVVMKHAFRNASVPIVTQAGLDIGTLLGGTAIIEQIFGWPGIGNFLLTSVMSRDYPVIAGFVLLIALIFVIVNIFVDILYVYIDPRMKPGGNING